VCVCVCVCVRVCVHVCVCVCALRLHLPFGSQPAAVHHRGRRIRAREYCTAVRHPRSSQPQECRCLVALDGPCIHTRWHHAQAAAAFPPEHRKEKYAGSEKQLLTLIKEKEPTWYRVPYNSTKGGRYLSTQYSTWKSSEINGRSASGLGSGVLMLLMYLTCVRRAHSIL